MTQRIFLAGASGAIGRRLAPLLVAKGWLVFGSTRSKSKVPQLKKLGIEPVVIDVFDAAGLQHLLAEIRPEVVIHQLTDLPYALEAGMKTATLARNARLRDEGTRNLVASRRRLLVDATGRPSWAARLRHVPRTGCTA